MQGGGEVCLQLYGEKTNDVARWIQFHPPALMLLV